MPKFRNTEESDACKQRQYIRQEMEYGAAHKHCQSPRRRGMSRYNLQRFRCPLQGCRWLGLHQDGQHQITLHPNPNPKNLIHIRIPSLDVGFKQYLASSKPNDRIECISALGHQECTTKQCVCHRLMVRAKFNCGMFYTHYKSLFGC